MAEHLTQDYTFISSYDQTEQPLRAIAAQTPNRPLVVVLHPWSWGYQHDSAPALEAWCNENNWNIVFPHFRGPAWEPLSCGHDAAVQDILDAVSFAVKTFQADASNVFLVGCSGGGYHSLLMAGRHPEVWKGVSAWAGISDLRAWHAQTVPTSYGYDKHIEAVCGGNPETDDAAAANAAHRSALTYLQPNQGCCVDINTGIHDGHTGSVPISQSLNAYNALVLPEKRIDSNDINFMVSQQAIPSHLRFKGTDDSYGKHTVLFRQQDDEIRVTIFEGGHEMVEPAVIAWLTSKVQ